jgi:hypothetical protein
MPRRRRLLLPVLALAAGLPATLACAMKTTPPDPVPVLAASSATETRLGNAPVTLTLPAPPEDKVAAITVGGGHLRLAIDGLEVLHPGAVYQVYLNLPEGRTPSPQDPHFVGTLSLYTDPGKTLGIRRTYDVTDQVKALRTRGEWKGPLRLTFVRERLDQPAGSASPNEPGEFLRFTRVTLLDR